VLYRLEIQNFYSILQRQVIDLRAAENAPDLSERLAPIWSGSAERAPKVVALFGPNASGKSNVLRALSFVAWFVRDSFQMKPDGWLPFQRFLAPEAAGEPTVIAIEFGGPADPSAEAGTGTVSCRYAYEVSFGGPADRPPHVLAESLHYWPSAAGRRVRLFRRDAEGGVAGGSAFPLGGYRQALAKVLRPNASVVSTLAQLDHPLAARLRAAAGDVTTNILLEKQDIGDDVMARHYAGDAPLLGRLNRSLERLDLGIQGMRIQPGAQGPIALFDHEGLAGPLVAPSESHGTRQFVKLFPYLDRALATGGVAVIDELDLAIHPLVLPELLRWFHDPGRNPHDAQLWMTCQNASLLENLIKEEVLFCAKDAKGRTRVYRMADIQGVRRDANYYRKYLGGTYGAVPHLG